MKGSTLMITGGTGSSGHTVLKHFLASDVAEIRVFSRDEKKQDDMRHRLQERWPDHFSKVRFYIGDVRDRTSVQDAMHGVDFVFHAAALKQVPSCEFFPMEAVRTNVIGTRRGERLFETLMTREEALRATDVGLYLRVAADARDLAHDEFVVGGEARTAAEESHTSHSTERLDVPGTVAKIRTAEYARLALGGRESEAAQ